MKTTQQSLILKSLTNKQLSMFIVEVEHDLMLCLNKKAFSQVNIRNIQS